MENLGIIKIEDGKKKINWKVLGIALSLFVMIILFALLLIVQLLPFFNFVDKALWIESVKFCIDKWMPIASVECGGVAFIGAMEKRNDK